MVRSPTLQRKHVAMVHIDPWKTLHPLVIANEHVNIQTVQKELLLRYPETLCSCSAALHVG